MENKQIKIKIHGRHSHNGMLFTKECECYFDSEIWNYELSKTKPS